MYQFQHEFQRKERIFKAYIFLFILTVLVNIVLFLVDTNSSYPMFRGSMRFFFLYHSILRLTKEHLGCAHH